MKLSMNGSAIERLKILCVCRSCSPFVASNLSLKESVFDRLVKQTRINILRLTRLVRNIDYAVVRSSGLKKRTQMIQD